MSRDHTPSCKRGASSLEEGDTDREPRSKKSRNSSIMDFMKPKPQRRRPQQERQEQSSETTSKYWARSQAATKESHRPSSFSPTTNPASSSRTPLDRKPSSSASGPRPREDDQDDEATADMDESKTIKLSESTGDIFSAPPQTLIIHACNCEGSWGAGIALAFKQKYPAAYKDYAAHCREHGSDLFGTALLIPPQKSDYGKKRDPHFVGCLFTSRSKGRKKDKPDQILHATGPAMMDLLSQVRDWNAKASEERQVAGARMCKINSGLFAVPWEQTASALEDIAIGDDGIEVVEVISREE